MPGFDGTGPMGQGAMTGRGMGYCIIPMDDDSKLYPVVNSTNNMPALRVYPYRPFRMRRFSSLMRFGRGRGRRFSRRSWL